ncbi:MAG: hypothetical protein HY708_02110, partial [Ignavibacteriae bacterium]|nr:hypothetical protein [Ignavibacteriota bacterium]
MKYIKTLTVVFFFFLLNQAGAFAQLTVILQQPPPFQFKVEHLWKVTLVNPTRTTFTVSLHGRATELSEGLIVDATTTRFVLPPGTKIINPWELVPINIREANPKYRDVVQNIGGVPTGDYEICVSVINAPDGQELGFACVQTSAENLTRMELLEPAEGARFTMFSSANEEVWNQPALIAPVAMNKGLRFLVRQEPGDSMVAYMMGDPVPGIDISLEQVPGGIRIPVKGWDEYMREVGIKEGGVKFAKVNIVTDSEGSTTAYLMGDPVPGVDISLEQNPGGIRVPLKGPDEYMKEGSKGPHAINVKKLREALDDLVQAAVDYNSSRSNVKLIVKSEGVHDGTSEEILTMLDVGIKDEGTPQARKRPGPVKYEDITRTLAAVGIKEEGVKRILDALDDLVQGQNDYNSSRSNVKL